MSSIKMWCLLIMISKDYCIHYYYYLFIVKFSVLVEVKSTYKYG